MMFMGQAKLKDKVKELKVLLKCIDQDISLHNNPVIVNRIIINHYHHKLEVI